MANKSGNSENEMKDTMALLRRVRQVRQFLPRHVPDEAVDNILQVARWTGSANNNQPWELVLVRNQDTLKQIVKEEGTESHLAGADFGIVIVMPGKNQTMDAFDEARMAERLLIAATAEDLGAGIWWFKDGGAAAKRVLGIPEDKQVRTAVSFGYPDTEAIAAAPKRPQARKPLDELAHREKF